MLVADRRPLAEIQSDLNRAQILVLASDPEDPKSAKSGHQCKNGYQVDQHQGLKQVTKPPDDMNSEASQRGAAEDLEVGRPISRHPEEKLDRKYDEKHGVYAFEEQSRCVFPRNKRFEEKEADGDNNQPPHDRADDPVRGGLPPVERCFGRPEESLRQAGPVSCHAFLIHKEQ